MNQPLDAVSKTPRDVLLRQRVDPVTLNDVETQGMTVEEIIDFDYTPNAEKNFNGVLDIIRAHNKNVELVNDVIQTNFSIKIGEEIIPIGTSKAYIAKDVGGNYSLVISPGSGAHPWVFFIGKKKPDLGYKIIN